MIAVYIVAWLLAIALGPAAYIATDKPRFSQRTKAVVRACALFWTGAAVLIPIGNMVRCLILSVTGP